MGFAWFATMQQCYIFFVIYYVQGSQLYTTLLTVPHWKNSVVFPYPLTNSLVWIQRVWYESEFQTYSVVWECGTEKKNLFSLKIMKKSVTKIFQFKNLWDILIQLQIERKQAVLYWRYWQCDNLYFRPK